MENGKMKPPQFMIKYGEEEHLKQLVNGKIRFTPSQTYIKIEEMQHNKGQGDLLEGKMKLKIEGARMHDPNTNEFIGMLPAGDIVISVQDVNNMPVFCLAQYSNENVTDYVNDKNYTIVLSDEKVKKIQGDFPKASHALIILEPDKFIEDVKNITNHQFANGVIHYYDYEINPIQMFMFLTTGSETIQTNAVMSMTYGNRYRHLLCKDISFSSQDEYRFIGLDELISEPVFYSFSFRSQYLIVPIEQLKQPLKIEI